MSQKRARAVALYDFTARDGDELTLEAGDELALLSSNSEDAWLQAINHRTKQQGYIPGNYVMKINNSDIDGINEAIKTSDDIPPPRPPRVAISSAPSESGISSSQEYQNSTNEICTVVRDFSNDDDFLVMAGDEVEILQKSHDGKVHCRSLLTHQVGFMPEANIRRTNSLDEEDWYVGKQDRESMNKLLLGPERQEGCYAVRLSESSGEYALSIRTQAEVKHYRLKKNEKGNYFINKSESFSSVKELLHHYRMNGGLEYKLTTPYTKGPNPWVIDRSCINTGIKLGSGNFGSVYKAEWTRKGFNVDVAVKMFHEEASVVKEDFEREVTSMRKLRHPCLVRLYGFCSEDDLMIVMELLVKGDMGKYLRKDGKQTNIKQLLQWSYQCASGMAYLENQNVIHRDLAARNVLLGNDLNARISDFGLSRELLEGVYEASNRQIPFKSTAPEYFETKKYTIKSDVWSFGVLLWEIFSYAKNPYPGINSIQKIQDYLNSGKRLEQPCECPVDLYKEVMLKCWEIHPAKRPSFENLKEVLNKKAKKHKGNSGYLN